MQNSCKTLGDIKPLPLTRNWYPCFTLGYNPLDFTRNWYPCMLLGFMLLAYPNHAARLYPGMVSPWRLSPCPLVWLLLAPWRLPLGLARLPLARSPVAPWHGLQWGFCRAPGTHAKQGNKRSLFRNTRQKVHECYTVVFTIAKQMRLKFTDTKPNLTYFAFQNAQTFPCYRYLFLCMLVRGVGVPSI